jgi:hypothetical protein
MLLSGSVRYALSPFIVHSVDAAGRTMHTTSSVGDGDHTERSNFTRDADRDRK